MPTYDSFTLGYLEAALWSSLDPDTGIPLDRDHGVEDIAPDTLAQMIKDCARFQLENADDLAEECAAPTALESSAYSGHDFWLTRNGHGAGFWDGDWPEPQATRLTDAAQEFGEVTLYVGGDGKVHAL